uniref:hypothetical protein n=1 Tax=Bartonella sp. CL71SXKL TaxID=3243540 RepID=UPI0035CFFC33
MTKPDDNDKVNYYFADDSQVQKDIQRTIVGTTNTTAVDPVIGSDNLAIGKQTIVSKPTVNVTSTTNGNTKTFHVHIDGDYAGFKHDTNG